MRFSLSLPTIRRPELADPYQESFELARLAEEAGMPAHDTEYSTLGEFEEQAEMIRLFGREVIPAFRD